MRSIKALRSYKKDFRREARSENVEAMATELPVVVAALAADAPLPPKYCDHLLEGEWRDHGECHIKPDFLLIYLKLGEDQLHLVRLGPHSELFR
ncbi:MAG: type II toxin-antitoxin system YafQ family toxin [Synergistaceae bacterium]|jgi:mRNA interferase YafQ|nr:type II toxin-antitoxin system YafQ family toxin [Synergistaceae bacterium]